MTEGHIDPRWADLLTMIKPRGATDLPALLAAVADRMSAAVAVVTEHSVVSEYGCPPGGNEALIDAATSDSGYVSIGGDESYHVARGLLPFNNAILLAGRIHHTFSSEEERAIATIAHVLDLGMATTERRLSRTSATLDEVFGASDTLTGLLTRDSFKDFVELSMYENVGSNSVLVIGLDGFKIANDTLGYATGDVVLQTVASRIQTSIRDGDVAARIGGDIFAIYSPGIGPDLAAEVARRVQNSISQRIPVGESDLIITASVGVVSSDSSEPADHLIANADTAMRSAKSHGQGHIDFYDEDLRLTVQRRRSLASELQDAIAENQLATMLEPIVSTIDMSIVGHEARVRWQHPTRGLLEAEQFMSLAADIGRVADVERAVFTFAMQEHFRDPNLPPTSVNLSPGSLIDARHIGWMVDQLSLMNISGSSLIVEVSEIAMNANPTEARENLAKLRAVGVGVVLDNFGTSASSIRSFHDFDFDGVKLHPALLSGVGDRQTESLLRAIYTSADVLGFDVIHIGVDTIAQFDSVRRFGEVVGRSTIFAQGAAMRHQVKY